MNERLRSYMEQLFANTPKTRRAVELKEEMLQNLTDRYNDLVAEGKDEEAAYNIAVASMGDISGLLDELKSSETMRPNYTPEELEREKRRSALVVSLAIGLYILCVIPLFILQNVTGLIVMLGIIAVATVLLIYNSMTKKSYLRTDDTVVEEFREWKESSNTDLRAIRAIGGAVWAVTMAVYLLISFTTGAWYITWLAFPIGGALNAVVKAIFDLKGQG